MRQRPFFVRRGGRVPEDAVQIASWTDDTVRFFPAGGGMEQCMSPDEFEQLHQRLSAAEYPGSVYRVATFDIDGLFGDLPGFTTGRRWNGWACPLFPRESCVALIDSYPGASFDPAREAFLIPREDAGPGDEAVETYLPQTITVDGRPIQVWAIGAGSWTWEETSSQPGTPGPDDH
jgi:hypothetical protein